MRNRNMIMALVAGGLALATTNLIAQGTEQAPPANSSPQSGQQGQFSKEAEPAQSFTEASNLKATSIIGLPVRNELGERLGKVEDLIVSMHSHSAPFAIVAYGGALGIGQTRVAVPLPDLKCSREPTQLILSATKTEFLAANSAPTGGWMAIADEGWTKNVDRFYGQPSATSASRFERQETSGMSEGREPVRTPAEQKGATILQNQPPGTIPEAGNMLPKPADEALTRKVNDLVSQDLADRAGDIQVTIKDGVVTMKGKVASDAQKHLLEDHIKALPGVDRVQDALVTVEQ